METLNMTTSAINSLGDWSSMGWMITIIVFLCSVIFLFLIFRNFRRVCYGSGVSGASLILYKFSRWIGVSTEEGNYTPLTWLGYIFGFIVVSIIIGKFIEKFKFIKKIEKSFEIEEEKKCQDQK